MPDLHFTTLIDGSAETVFALIADLAHYDRWLSGSRAFGAITQIAPLPVGLGTTYIDAGPSGTRHGEVTEYDPPTRISFHQPMQVKQGLLTGTIDIHLRHTLEPVEQMTRLNRDLTLGIQGLFKVAQPFVIASFRQENERMLLALKRYVEREPEHIARSCALLSICGGCFLLQLFIWKISLVGNELRSFLQPRYATGGPC